MQIKLSFIGALITIVLSLAACSDDSDSSNASGSSGTGGASGSAGSGGSNAAGSGGSSGQGGSGATGGSGGSAGSGGSNTSNPWDTYCAAAAQKEMDCGTNSGQTCPSSDCIASVYEASLIQPLADCLLARTCDQLNSDDDCVDQVSFPNGPSADQQAEAQACTAKIQQCEADGFVVAGDHCGTMIRPLTKQSIRDALKTCFDGECSALQSCIDTAIAPASCFD